jgi:hypothetical protein
MNFDENAHVSNRELTEYFVANHEEDLERVLLDKQTDIYFDVFLNVS